MDHYILHLFIFYHPIFLNSLVTFKLFQGIPTNSAATWQYYRMEPEDYLIVANYYSSTLGYNIKSKLYRFSGTLFAEAGQVSTTGASCISLFSIDYHVFLFVGFQSNASTSKLNSVIYQVNP